MQPDRRLTMPVAPYLIAWAIFAACIAESASNSATAEEGLARITIVDAQGRPLPCRIHCKDAAGNPVRCGVLPFFRDHFSCPGTAELRLPKGTYTYEIERGPEFARHTGEFELAEGGNKAIDVRLRRIADLAAEGWYSGDLHVHRPLEHMALLMRAEDLHVAPVITFKRSGWFLIRAIADNERTFRFASTAPYYVEIGSEKRSVSERSAQFFLDWVEERIQRVRTNLTDPEELREVLVYHQRAKAFWQDKVAAANAD